MTKIADKKEKVDGVSDLPLYVEPGKTKEVVQSYIDRGVAAKAKIPDLIKNGAGFTPYADMILYMVIATPTLTEEEMEGMDGEVLDVIFEGDKEGDVSEQKLILITKGPDCQKDMEPGDRIAIRGHAFKVTTPKGTFLTVREYDVIGKYE